MFSVAVDGACRSGYIGHSLEGKKYFWCVVRPKRATRGDVAGVFFFMLRIDVWLDCASCTCSALSRSAGETVWRCMQQ